MENFTRKLAAVMSSTDAVPRMIQHEGMAFLITPQSEVWRVLDTTGPESATRSMPVDGSMAWGRVFVGGGPDRVVRTYRFSPDERRSVTAEELWRQLGQSKAGDETAG